RHQRLPAPGLRGPQDRRPRGPLRLRPEGAPLRRAAGRRARLRPPPAADERARLLDRGDELHARAAGAGQEAAPPLAGGGAHRLRGHGDGRAHDREPLPPGPRPPRGLRGPARRHARRPGRRRTLRTRPLEPGRHRLRPGARARGRAGPAAPAGRAVHRRPARRRHHPAGEPLPRPQAPGDDVNSIAFRRERQATWAELEMLVARIEGDGLQELSPEDTSRLPTLYRATLSSLSVARAISLDANLLAYLEG